jgi:hypothetical protein
MEMACVMSRIVRVDIDIHSLDESILCEVKDAAETPTRRFASAPRFAFAIGA